MAGFQLLPSGLEEGYFQQVPEGWLFAGTNPWIFPRRRIYLLTDAQKPAIAARVRRGTYLRLLLLLPVIPILVAAFVYYPALLNFYSATSWVGLVALTAGLTVILTLSDYLNMQPLLQDVPRSSQKMQLRSMMQGQSRAMSVSALSIFTLIFFLGFLANIFSAFTTRHGAIFAAIGAVVMLLLTIGFGKMLVEKLRARQAETESGLTPEKMAARLSRIERTSVIQNFGIVALVVLSVIAGVMLGNLFDQSDNPSVRSLVLRNAKGDIIASLRTGSDGLPVFALWDGNNKLRAALGLSRSGTPFFTLSDTDGKIRSSMTMLASPDAAKQNATLQFYDENGKFRMWAGINERGTPSLTLADSAGKIRSSMTTLTSPDAAKQNGILQFFDENGKFRMWTGVNDRGPHVWMYDKNNVLRLSANVDDGGPHIRTLDEFGKELSAQK